MHCSHTKTKTLSSTLYAEKMERDNGTISVNSVNKDVKKNIKMLIEIMKRKRDEYIYI